MNAAGRYAIQYYEARGWWTGHHGVDLADPAKYIAGVNKRPGFADCPNPAERGDRRARAIDKETGEIYGDQTACTFCSLPHEGVDGSCLL